VPDALAKICAALALRHGEQGRGARGALHAALVMHIHGGNTDARKVLETRATPIVRRIDARVTEAKNRAAPDAANGLTEVQAFIHANDEDLHLIEILCGRSAEYYREVSQSVADMILNGLVAYQRHTGDDCGCLPVLIYLLDMEVTPELKTRLADTFRIVHSNALSGQRRNVPEKRLGPATAEPDLSDYEKDYRVIEEHVVAGLPKLGLGKTSRATFAARVAGMLKDLAFAAYRENDNFALAEEAFATAFELPCGDAVRTNLENDRAKLQREVGTRKEKELRLQNGASVLQINRQGVDLNGRWTPAADLAGLRHKVEPGPAGDLAAAIYVVAWRTTKGVEFELNATNLLPPSENVGQDYARILDAFYYFFVPSLIERLAAAVRRGEEVLIGETPVKRNGMVLASPARFGARDELVPYSSLEFKLEDGQLSLSSKHNPWLSDSYVVADTWNAVIFRQLIEAVQRE
jgi:dephospho-CoA kinase